MTDTLPRVTELIPKPTFFVSDERLEEIREEGTEQHSMLKMYRDTGDLFNDPFLIALDAWWKENETCLGEVLCYEKNLISKLKFSGTPDIVCEKAIIDLKRSAGDNKIRALQLAGYSILAKEHYGVKTKKWIIIVFDGKKIKSTNVYNSNAENCFRLLVQRYYINQSIDNYFK